MKYTTLFDAYNNLFILMDDLGWDMNYIESLVPWELEVMITLAREKQEAKKLAQRQSELSGRY